MHRSCNSRSHLKRCRPMGTVTTKIIIFHHHMEIWESFPKCQMLGGRCETLDELDDLEEGHSRVLSETSHCSSVTSLLQHLMYFGSKIWILPFGKISGSGNYKYLERGNISSSLLASFLMFSALPKSRGDLL